MGEKIYNEKNYEIVSSNSAKTLVEQITNNPVINLEMCLNIGKLDTIINNKREELREYNGNLKYDFNKELDEISKYDNIRIWSSIYDADDYCLLLFLCNRFKEKNISVIYSNEFNNYATTITNLLVEDIREYSTKEHKLKDYEKEDFIKEWNYVINDNKELRYMINGIVKSTDINCFDESIINRLKEIGECFIYELIGNLMVNPIIEKVFLSEWIYMYLIIRLENDNRISINENDEIIVAEH